MLFRRHRRVGTFTWSMKYPMKWWKPHYIHVYNPDRFEWDFAADYVEKSCLCLNIHYKCHLSLKQKLGQVTFLHPRCYSFRYRAPFNVMRTPKCTQGLTGHKYEQETDITHEVAVKQEQNNWTQRLRQPSRVLKRLSFPPGMVEETRKMFSLSKVSGYVFLQRGCMLERFSEIFRTTSV